MKIKKINIPEDITSSIGLAQIQMDRLKDIVLIAGKNGSGKSRLLNLIKDNLINIPNSTRQIELNRDVKSHKEQIKIYENYLQISDEEIIHKYGTSREGIVNNLKYYYEQLKISESKLISLEYFEFDKDEAISVVYFVPKSLRLTDSYTISKREIDNYANNIYEIGIESIAKGAIPEIDRVVRRWITASSGVKISEEDKNKAIQDYEKLKKYVKLFLNTDLESDIDGNPTIFNTRIGEANLSDGQTILLQFCMALYAQEIKLDNLIIFMDEPENHLHPAALIEVLDKISSQVRNGQIWIATHSINVLAHFDPSNIWYMENGEISYAGNVPQKVLNGLLGDESEIDKLSNFLDLPAKMSMNNFAYESLLNPEVVFTDNTDPQTNQIHKLIQKKIDSGEKIKVLDFGIGKGRLLASIHENERLNGRNVTDWLDFYGFDITEEYKDELEELFKEIYGDSSTRFFNDKAKLISSLGENTFDFIIMSNVFHEIEPKYWINLFNSPTSVFNTLKDEGVLLIIEDQYLAVGEKAHANGFLVFDELEFKKLFKIEQDDGYITTDYRGDGRLKSHHIPKKCITRIDSNSKKVSLEVLLQNSKDKIKVIRAKDSPTFKDGKLHGFWSQQLANASLVLEEL
ncbi:AAA family ATPase [Empedobacter sp. GD03861]|uniref:AAA family ATPase n=1 Tax=Empedobacter sp. GD03861 TaxID=2975390 RepID=UPI0024476BA6|nr:AAA family ATPase [Empedobacter sp. GD03861]MDH0673909.1 AAA family ATPase [Empedobacter sp. GD03861]